MLKFSATGKSSVRAQFYETPDDVVIAVEKFGQTLTVQKCLDNGSDSSIWSKPVAKFPLSGRFLAVFCQITESVPGPLSR